jgi:hypothetical protein
MNSARMSSRPGFLEGVAVAAVASLAGGAVHALLWLLLGPGSARVATVALVGLGYLGYLLWRAPEPAGRLSLLLAGTGITAAALVLAPHWLLAAQLGLLWLARALLLQRGPLAALADLGLVLLGLGAGVWALSASGSLAAALWSFFLVQALFPLLGTLTGPRQPETGAPEGDDDGRFDWAERSAAASLQRLAALRDLR